MKRNLKSQSGMSLVSTLMAAAIGMVVVMGLASSVSMMYQGVKNNEIAQNAVDVLGELKLTLSNPINCAPAIAGKAFDPAGKLDVAGQIKLNNGWLLQIGQEVTSAGGPQDAAPVNGLKVGTLQIASNQSIAPIRFPIGSGGATSFQERRVATLIVGFQKVIGGQTIDMAPSYIPVNIYTDLTTPNVIGGCTSTLQYGAADCTDLNMVPIEVTDPVDATKKIYQCAAKGSCRKGGSYSDGPLGNGGFGNPMAGGLQTCPEGYTAKRTGSITNTTDCGKWCLDRKNYGVYECMSCLDDTGNDIAVDAVASTPNAYNIDYSAENADLDNTTAYQDQINTDATNALLSSPTPAGTPVCHDPGYAVIPPPGGSCSQGSPVSAAAPLCCSGTATYCYATYDLGADWGPPEVITESEVCN